MGGGGVKLCRGDKAIQGGQSHMGGTKLHRRDQRVGRGTKGWGRGTKGGKERDKGVGEGGQRGRGRGTATGTSGPGCRYCTGACPEGTSHNQWMVRWFPCRFVCCCDSRVFFSIEVPLSGLFWTARTRTPKRSGHIFTVPTKITRGCFQASSRVHTTNVAPEFFRFV